MTASIYSILAILYALHIVFTGLQNEVSRHTPRVISLKPFGTYSAFIGRFEPFQLQNYSLFASGVPEFSNWQYDNLEFQAVF